VPLSTAHTLEVLLLLADGRTNRQISEQLFITRMPSGEWVISSWQPEN
jgi:hypothetical protein